MKIEGRVKQILVKLCHWSCFLKTQPMSWLSCVSSELKFSWLYGQEAKTKRKRPKRCPYLLINSALKTWHLTHISNLSPFHHACSNFGLTAGLIHSHLPALSASACMCVCVCQCNLNTFKRSFFFFFLTATTLKETAAPHSHDLPMKMGKNCSLLKLNMLHRQPSGRYAYKLHPFQEGRVGNKLSY